MRFHVQKVDLELSPETVWLRTRRIENPDKGEVAYLGIFYDLGFIKCNYHSGIGKHTLDWSPGIFGGFEL